ncbi:sugar ABC transporter permease [Lachnospiraceae bacterium WCA3-601-WT-6H]|uniref:Sugar ABC transporter permease n=2 Tax=Waltera intestinalis TaxID=2606635 RepID=A0A6L5YHY9_9FIRM|nr:sugar ABC transporter permease [Waltera intestinalis]
MPQVNLGAGTVLADTLFPQETAGETLRKQELAKEKSYETALKKEITNKWKRTLTGWLLLAPSLVFLCVFTIYPIVKSIISSFYLDNLSVMQPVFAGFSNYIALFQDKVYWECFWNNLLIAVVTVPLSIGLAVAMAMFANSLKWGKAAARLGFTYPTFIPLVAAANIWMFIYTPIYGLLGYINPNWRFLADGKTAIWAVMVMLVWKQAGYIMLFYVAGLHGISRELFEAAKIDGANGWQIFTRVTWPMLKPTTIYVLIITLTNAYKMVDHLYIMTKGGPGNATNVLLFYIYQTGFDYWDTGKASAMTVILVAVLLMVTSVCFFVQDKKAYYNN